jgi:hypothetical protein
MRTFIVTLTQEFRVPVVAENVSDAIDRAESVMPYPEAQYDTDTQSYTSNHVTPAYNNQEADNRASENEEVYLNQL